MRRITPALVLVVALLTLPQVAGAQTTQSFEAHFTNVLQKNSPSFCPGGPLANCGSGTVSGFGAASYILVPTSAGPLSDGCQSVTAVAAITLADGRGSFTADVTGTVCFPGNSHNAPGHLLSFGNPFTARGTFVIVGGSGIFADATGSGTATLRSAGAHSKLDATGTITF